MGGVFGTLWGFIHKTSSEEHLHFSVEHFFDLLQSYESKKQKDCYIQHTHPITTPEERDEVLKNFKEDFRLLLDEFKDYEDPELQKVIHIAFLKRFLNGDFGPEIKTSGQELEINATQPSEEAEHHSKRTRGATVTSADAE